MTYKTHFDRYSQGMNAEQLTASDYTRIADLADQEVIMITESLHVMQQTGAVSRGMLEPVAASLPGLNLNAFTSIPTATNHGIALEALSRNVKIAIAVGAVAVLGTAIFFALRIKGRAVPVPKKDRAMVADEMEKVLDSAVKQMEKVDSTEILAAAQKDAGEGKGTEVLEDKELAAAVSNFENFDKWMTSPTVNSILGESGANLLTADLLAGSYSPLINMAGTEIAEDIRALCSVVDKELLTPILRFDGTTDLQELLTKSENNMAKVLDQIKGGSADKAIAWFKKEGFRVKTTGDDELGINEYYVAWSAKYLERFSGSSQYDRSPTLLSDHDISDRAVAALAESQREIGKLADKMERIKEHLAKYDVSKKASRSVRAGFEDIKSQLACADQFLHICAHEINAYNLAANLKGKVCVNTFKKVAENITALKVAGSRALGGSHPALDATIDLYETALLKDYKEVVKKARALG